MKNKKLKTKIAERITNLNTLGQIPADEVQLNLDVVYNSILDEVCSVVPMNSPSQIISTLFLRYGSKNKAINDKNNDVVNTTLMNNTGAMPLDSNGYVTDNVEFEINNATEFVGSYKKILPKTIIINNNIFDDGEGNLIDENDSVVGTVDYITAVFKYTGSATDVINVKYKFDIYNVDTDRNFAYFQKSFVRVFADMYQLDVDSALALNDFKGLNLQENIDKILPEVLAQQIDNHILSKYFDQLELATTHVVNWDATVNWDTNRTIPVTKLYEDLGTLIGVEIGAFTKRTGVMPNIILCDALSFGIIKVHPNFIALTTLEQNNVEYSGTPRFVGYLGDAKVIVVQHSINDDKGHIVITYKGTSDAQAAGVYTPFIPVTLRNVIGMESGGMISTNNIYSIGGFTFTNPDLISGITVENINLPQ